MFQKAKKAHRWVILTLLLMLGCAQPWEREPGPFDRNDLPLNIYNLRGNVWVAEDYNYYRTNLSMYIDHDAGVVFIGAGWSYKSARQLLWKAAANSYGPFQALIVPGYRLSYTGGLPPFQRHELKVIMQQNAPVLLRLHWDHMQQEMLQSFGSWREFEPVEADVLYQNHFTMMDGAVEVYHFGHAHSPDNTLVFFPRERVLYAGSVLSDPLLFMDQANLEKYDQVLNQIAELEFDTIIAGHGESVHNRTLLDNVRQQIHRLRQTPTADEPR